jgi:glycosyltransferase involved in cell wall biosynthesis
LTNSKYIYNGIHATPDTESDFNIRKNIAICDEPLCLMLGTYESRKGHKFIFESFKQVLKVIPEAHLVICGGGSKKEIAKVDKIRKRVVPGGNVHLFGFVHGGASIISQTDVLLIGSQEFESFGYTAVEAMIRSKPIVSTNTGGLPEVIGLDSACGYIVDHKNTSNFSERIISLLKDKELRKSMGEAGKNRANKMFNAQRMSREYLSMIKKKL